ncbi:MAG: ribose-phosphate pyrophosphokinase [Clostridia bacterium]|nr:ribose-phosphate pyrophosphokinase [Clostridia bacterium]
MTSNMPLFTNVSQHGPLALIVLESAKELGDKIDKHLIKWMEESTGRKVDTFITPSKCPRFTTGDGKGMLYDSIRGKDVYILVDVGNYSCTYTMFETPNRMSPDDHYADLKRMIAAIGGKAERITVIMPMLYGGRQHKRSFRESLDAASMLQELYQMGVKDIITFDAHDPRVQNAEPLMGFDNFMPTYQVLKALFKKYPNVKFDKDHFMIVSPDEGAMSRNIYYSSVLGADLGMYYKRRDYTTIVNGRNPIVAHEYLGNSVMGMDVFVADDIIATGDSTLSLAKELREAGANRIFLNATYALFTEGIDRFRKAYEEGIIESVVATNLTYMKPELKDEPWFTVADMSKYIALIIAACNQNRSVGDLLDPISKIHALLENRK